MTLRFRVVSFFAEIKRSEEYPMKGFLSIMNGVSRFLYVIAGISLTFLMLLTIADVILRFFKTPIPGTYELVGFSGAIAIGFALPITSWMRGQVFVDFFIIKFSKPVQSIFNIGTRILVMILFYLMAWNLFKYAADLHRSGEVSPTLRFPFYPFAYGVGICCFVQCLIMVTDIIKIFGGEYE